MTVKNWVAVGAPEHLAADLADDPPDVVTYTADGGRPTRSMSGLGHAELAGLDWPQLLPIAAALDLRPATVAVLVALEPGRRSRGTAATAPSRHRPVARPPGPAVTARTARTTACPPWALAVAAMLSVQLRSALSVDVVSTVGPAGTAWLRLSFGAPSSWRWPAHHYVRCAETTCRFCLALASQPGYRPSPFSPPSTASRSAPRSRSSSWVPSRSSLSAAVAREPSPGRPWHCSELCY